MDDLKRRLRERADAAAAEGTATATGDALHFREAADAIEALRGKLRDMHRRAQTAEAALREPIEAAAPERRTLGRVLANAAFYAEHDRAEALQAQLAEARDDAAFVAAQLQAVLDMSPPPQEGILKKRLHELAARKNALAEARDKALEDAARRLLRCFPNMGMIDEFADAIRALKDRNETEPEREPDNLTDNLDNRLDGERGET